MSILRDSIVIDTTVIPGGGSADVPIATTTTPGIVKPDGTTTTVDEDGTLHCVGGGGTSDYNDLDNKPTLDGTTIEGNMTSEGLGLATTEALETVSSNIMGSDAYNPSTEYAPNDDTKPKYCIYENALYKNIVACSNILPTDSTHWKRVTLLSIDEEMATPFADFTNQVGSITAINQSWTATDNALCFCLLGSVSGYGCAAYIDGVQIASTSAVTSTSFAYPYATSFYVKKGQKVTTSNISGMKVQLKFYKLTR